MEKTQLINSLESLKLYPIESSVLNAALASLWFHLSQSVQHLVQRYSLSQSLSVEEAKRLEQDASEAHDLLQLAKRTIVKLTSKSDIVEVITKRVKIMEDIQGIESKLQSGGGEKREKVVESATQRFAIQLDLLASLRLLLHLRESILFEAGDGHHDHISSLTALIDYLNSQRNKLHLPCQIPVWSLEGCFGPAKLAIDEVHNHRRLPHFEDDDDQEGHAGPDEEAEALNNGFGTASRAIWQGNAVMVKRVSANHFHEAWLGLREAVTCLESNSRYLQSSPYLVSLIGISWESDFSHCYFITPLASQLSLSDAFTNPDLKPETRIELSPAQKASILLDVCNGLNHLHSFGLVHGRLKDSNILLFDGYRAKLSDFGVETFLTDVSRMSSPGKHGYRWLAPEFVQHMNRLEQVATLASGGDLPSLEESVALVPSPVSPAVDSYAFGILTLVLLTEQLPFANVIWEEGVKTQLMNGSTPHLPSEFKEKATMGFLRENIVIPCVETFSSIRPRLKELQPVVEDAYVKIAKQVDEMEYHQHCETIESVESELVDIKKKIADYQLLIQKGKEIIAKKEIERIKIVDAKQRRERDLELERARIKLLGFQGELEGLDVDRDGAEADLEELKALRDQAQDRKEQSRDQLLSLRPPLTDSFVNHQEMLQRYFTQRELEIYSDKLSAYRSSAYVEAEDLGVVRSYSWTPSVLAKSPFAKTYESISELSEQQTDELRKLINAGGSPYSHLVDQLDLIFRVPINAKSLKTSQNINFTPINPISLSRPVERDLPDLHGDRTISIMSEISPAIRRDDGYVDSDDDDEADVMSLRGTVSGMRPSHSRPRPSFVREQDFVHYYDDPQKKETVTAESKALENGKWEIQLTEVVSSADDGFPDNDFDIVHVQYLAASRGNWSESVGLRRHGLGYSDEAIADFLDRRYTPLHLAALLGNIAIFQQLVEEGGLSPFEIDHKGNTPMHYACDRGHLAVVRYLCEHHHYDINFCNNQNVSPIQLALKGGFLDIIEYLMELAPTTLSCDWEDSNLGASLLHWACLSNSIELIDYLLFKQSIPIEKVCEKDMSTALLWASFGGSNEIVEYLIAHANANRFVKNSFGQSCLHMAAMSGSRKKVVYLMDCVGLKITDKDSNHKTPYEVADGEAAIFLKERKKKGFVTGSIAEKNRNSMAANAQSESFGFEL
eukprot:gene10609-11756_t